MQTSLEQDQYKAPLRLELVVIGFLTAGLPQIHLTSLEVFAYVTCLEEDAGVVIVEDDAGVDAYEVEVLVWPEEGAVVE